MKILAIGNSFSEDATYYLHKIARSAGTDLRVVNLYIGGCTIDTHAENIRQNAPAYRYEENGLHTAKMVSIADTLQEEAWDIVTVQQQSGMSGIYDSYGQIGVLLDCIKQYAPQAKIWFHQTWAYEVDSDHGEFPLYGRDQKVMANAIRETVTRVCGENGGLPVIPCGDVIARLRESAEFNVEKGGLSICRDGFHVSLVYGRYLLGLTWYVTLCGGDPADVTFVPTPADIVNGFRVENFSCEPDKIDLIRKTVADVTA